MPLYEYQCDACSNRFEKIQKFSDPPIDTCPSCGGTVQKLLSSPAIQFKGSGWYITDYAKKSTGDSKGGKAEGSGDKGGDTSAEKSTDSKSADRSTDSKKSGDSSSSTPAAATSSKE